MLDLMGVHEIAVRLGVSRQRAHAISGTHADFPQPAAKLAAGPIWITDEVERWIANHPERRPGRPSVADALTYPPVIQAKVDRVSRQDGLALSRDAGHRRFFALRTQVTENERF